LVEIETRDITVQRLFTDFDEFWAVSSMGSSVRPTLATMSVDDIEQLKARVRAQLPQHPTGQFAYTARANAIKGRMPA